MSPSRDLAVGDELPPLSVEPCRPQLFRYSATTWNAHRIHYDPEHAKAEGHPDVLVQAHLHGAFVQRLLMDWLGTDGRLTELSWQNVGRAVPEEELAVGARVTAVEGDRVEFEVWTANDRGRCAEGAAAVVLE